MIIDERPYGEFTRQLFLGDQPARSLVGGPGCRSCPGAAAGPRSVPARPRRVPVTGHHLGLASLGQLIESQLAADDRLDEAGCLALRSLALLADIAPAAAELDRRAEELEHQVRVLRDLVAPVAVRCTDHAWG